MITLRGITWDHPRGHAPLAASVEQYAREHGVQVTWESRSLKDFGDAPLPELARDYDLLIIDHPHVGQAAASGVLLPLDTCLDAATLNTLAAESAGPSHGSYFYAGHQWGLAVDTAMQASAYRADLLNEALPEIWADVLALGHRMRTQGRYVAMPLVPTDAICSFISLCANLGSPIGQNDGLVSESVGLEALEFLVEMAAIGHPSALSWNPIFMLNHMSSNDDVVYCPLTFCYTNYSRDGYAPKRVNFSTIPGIIGSILGGAGFAVSARCQHPAEACAYGAWLSSAEIQRTLYTEAGGQPGNRVAWTDAAANALTHDFFRDTLDTLVMSYVRPRHDGFVDFQVEAGNIIHAMLRDRTPTSECLARLERLYAETQRE
jgi:multiple sugar transport system substrate-binding protein